MGSILIYTLRNLKSGSREHRNWYCVSKKAKDSSVCAKCNSCRSQRSWGKVIFSQASVILSTGGLCMVAGRHRWLSGACMVVGGMCGCRCVCGCGRLCSCRGHAWLWGACVVLGGMRGSGGHVWFWGACVVAGGHAWWQGACVVAGGHAWDTMRYGQ